MKKFFLPLVLAFTILITTAATEAADVPGFHQVGGRYLTFTGRENINSKGYRAYGYDCNIDLNEDFAERYMRALVNNYNFKLIGHYVQDYRRTSAHLYETWVFAYNGSKKVSTFTSKDRQHNRSYSCQLTVERTNRWDTDTRHFSIRVAYGLTYGED